MLNLGRENNLRLILLMVRLLMACNRNLLKIFYKRFGGFKKCA